jgi:hypothetical protein
MTQELETALKFYDFERGEVPKDDIIAVRIQVLDKYLPPFTCPFDLVFLGYDIVIPGEWSLLTEGYFSFPETFSEFERFITPHGLFAETNVINAYVQAYISAAEKRTDIEPVPVSSDRLVSVAVYLLPTSQIH